MLVLTMLANTDGSNSGSVKVVWITISSGKTKVYHTREKCYGGRVGVRRIPTIEKAVVDAGLRVCARCLWWESENGQGQVPWV